MNLQEQYRKKQLNRLQHVVNLFHANKKIKYFGDSVAFHSYKMDVNVDHTRHTFRLQNDSVIVIDVPHAQPPYTITPTPSPTPEAASAQDPRAKIGAISNPSRPTTFKELFNEPRPDREPPPGFIPEFVKKAMVERERNAKLNKIAELIKAFTEEQPVFHLGRSLKITAYKMDAKADCVSYIFELQDNTQLVIDMPYNEMSKQEVSKAIPTATGLNPSKGIQSPYGCFNRLAKVHGIIVQDGYYHADSSSSRRPRYVVVESSFHKDHPSQKDKHECEYTYSSLPDARCAGCKHRNPEHSITNL